MEGHEEVDSARGEADLGGGDGGVAKARAATMELEELDKLGTVDRRVLAEPRASESTENLRRLLAGLDRELGCWG